MTPQKIWEWVCLIYQNVGHKLTIYKAMCSLSEVTETATQIGKSTYKSVVYNYLKVFSLIREFPKIFPRKERMKCEMVELALKTLET